MERLVREEGLRLFLLLAGRPGHADGERKHDGTEKAQCFGLSAGEEAGDEPEPQEHLGDRDVGQGERHQGEPEGGPPALHLCERDEHVGHTEGRTPSAEVDHDGERGHVDADADVEAEGADRGMTPRLDQHRQRARRGDDREVEPRRVVGDEMEVAGEEERPQCEGRDNEDEQDR